MTGADERRRMVDAMQAAGHARDARMAEAFRTVPRELFVPLPLAEVYRDDPLPTMTKSGAVVSTSSQPSMMALMLEQAELRPGLRVLEVGGGSGYNAAVMASIVGDGGFVTTMEYEADLADEARENLRQAEAHNVRVVAGDGGEGHPPGGPYDRIIATAACWQIPPPWLDQLTADGLIVMPLRINLLQASVAVRRRGARLQGDGMIGCRFLRLAGAHGPNYDLDLGGGSTLTGDAPWDETWDLPALLQRSRPVGRFPPLHPREFLDFQFYLALQGAPLGGLFERGGSAPRTLVVQPGSALLLREGDWPPRLFGGEAALHFRNAALDRWRRVGSPQAGVATIEFAPGTRQNPLPEPSGDGFRFRRGRHDVVIRLGA